MRILIAGGGTAGHVFPALALARHLADRHGAEVGFAGTASGLEATIVAAAGFPFTVVDARPLVRGISLRALIGPAAALRSVARCRPLVEGADVVVGMGGYVSVPVALAAVRARRPLVLHEQNAVPGLANRLLSRTARAVGLSFAEAGRLLPGRARAVVTGNPVREEIAAVPGARDVLRKEARDALDLEEGRSTVLVFGGSRGALHVDRAAVGALRLLRDRADLQLVLLTGPAHIEEVRRALPADTPLRVRAYPFLERMELAYAVADLAVARAGATTIAELSICGLPSILIPYPYATGRHQEANARAVQRAGAAEMVMDDGLSAAVLAERVGALIGNRERLRAMSERATAWSRPDAADALSGLVLGAAMS